MARREFHRAAAPTGVGTLGIRNARMGAGRILGNRRAFVQFFRITFVLIVEIEFFRVLGK